MKPSQKNSAVPPSFIRQDLVSGDWILIAPGRFQYTAPHKFILKRKKRKIAAIKTCPFEDPFKNVDKDLIIGYESHKKIKDGKEKHWKNFEIVVLKNKHPVVFHYHKLIHIKNVGPYHVLAGAGHHDLIITRDHQASFPYLSKAQAFHLFEVFRDRYLSLFADKNIAYISIFHNWGPLAGASVFHPHYQLIGLPVIPSDIKHSLIGSRRFFRRHKKCVHCLMIEWERQQKKRVVFETDKVIALAPFVSHNAFEVRIFPKKHLPYFENTSDEDLEEMVEGLQNVLRRLGKSLNDPDYNFFIHTAPLKNKEKYHHYHWHITVYPKISIRAGFEYSTGMEINIIDPDLAAKMLKT